MAVINLDLGQLPFSSNLRYSQYLDCLKFAIEVIVTSLNTDPPSTEIAFRGPDGTVERDCLFYFRGNPYGLAEGESQSYTPQTGGTDTPNALMAAAAMVTSFTFAERNEAGELVEIFTVKDLDPVSPATLISILTDTLDSYARFVALLDGDTTVRGSGFKDEIEVGAGNDLVRAGDGDDLILKWRSGDLDCYGGAGIDTLDFDSSFSVFSPLPPLVEPLVIDLRDGTGRNPFGGALTLKSVEVVHTVGGVANTILGSQGSDTVAGASLAAGDILSLRGGDDVILAAISAQGAVDGGGGWDIANISEIYTPSVLDLSDPAANSGIFAGGSFVRVEEFILTGRSGTGGMLLDFFGTGGADVVGYFATFLFPGNPIGAATLHLRGGDDSAHGGGGDDILYGGAGNDTLAGGNAVPNQNAGDDRLYGGAGRDRLDGGGGNDTQTGGAAHDVFVFADGFGDDRVTDFVPDRDRLDFRGHTGIDSFDDLRLADRAAGALVKDGAGNSVLLVGVAVDDLTEADFLF